MSIFRNPNPEGPEFIGFVNIRVGNSGPGDFRFVVKGETKKEVSEHIMNMVHDAVNNAKEYSDDEEMVDVVRVEENPKSVLMDLPTDFGE